MSARKEFLTSRAECYLLQRLDRLKRQLDEGLRELDHLHCRETSVANCPALREAISVSGEINSLLTLCSLLGEINVRAAEWSAAPPQAPQPEESCAVRRRVDGHEDFVF